MAAPWSCPGRPGIGKTRLAAELATMAHAAGARSCTFRRSRPADDPGLAELADAPGDRPTLIIVDDLDAAATRRPSTRIAVRARDLAGRPACCSSRTAARLRRGSSRWPSGWRRPSSAGRSARSTPDAVRSHRRALRRPRRRGRRPSATCSRESGGVPAAVHRVASQWARTEAAGRLGASADRTAAGRRGLRDAEAALIDDVADLELARERERLYAVDADGMTGDRQRSRTICPYKGLAEFEAADADYYFGRERLDRRAHRPLRRAARSSGLVGDSGSGKSSALRAGLLPALAAGVLPGSDGWPQAMLRPGEHPLAELRRALARALPDRPCRPTMPSAALDAALAGLAAGQRLVVVVDQFEEVFNATRDDAERSAFIDLLTGERPGLKVIVAMRADHYGRCAAYPALARLARLRPGARRSAVERRARGGHRASRAAGRPARGARR